ncbi:MAG: FAD-dependent thymidylate synthase, partial [Bombella apis]|nr:FAD-dependent thymidylate synthase [Bombella apis]
PEAAHIAAQSTVNHQGRGESLSAETAQQVLAILQRDALQCYGDYEEMLDPEGMGVARELARINLTLNTYTQWYWKIDLHNLMHFLALRADSHAQYEIRVYAQKMIEILKAWVPHTAQAFEEYRLGAYSFSAGMLKVLRRRLAGEVVTQESSGLTKREWTEMQAVLEG